MICMTNNVKNLPKDVKVSAPNGMYVGDDEMNANNQDAAAEPKLIKEYAELTGSSDSTARSVLMYVCSHEDACQPRPERTAAEVLPGPHPNPQADTDEN